MSHVRVEVLRERHGGLVVAPGGSPAGYRLLVSRPAAGPVPFAERPAALRRTAILRSRRLLYDYLDRRQRAEARASGGLFWEHTPLGWFRLGRRYDIRFRPTGAPATEQSLCVVTDDLDVVPDDDVWLNLLLFLRAGPSEFLETAFVLIEDSTTGDEPDDEVGGRERLELLARERDRCWQSGEHLSAGFVDLTIAQIHRAWANPAAALPHAVRSAVVVTTLGSVLPDLQRTRWLAAHAPAFDLLATAIVKDPSGERALALARQEFSRMREQLLRGPAVDAAEADLLAWIRAVVLVDRTFGEVTR